jgi:hypothetical protein
MLHCDSAMLHCGSAVPLCGSAMLHCGSAVLHCGSAMPLCGSAMPLCDSAMLLYVCRSQFALEIQQIFVRAWQCQAPSRESLVRRLAIRQGHPLRSHSQQHKITVSPLPSIVPMKLAGGAIAQYQHDKNNPS